MPTKFQIDQTLQSLKEYKRKYIRKEFNELDESATRIMINMFLTNVLDFKELEEIKTEYNIKGEYADYVIQYNRKKQFVVEVKSIQIDINDKHLRQSMSYATNEGIDWILLTNGRSFQFYRVIFGKPVSSELVFSYSFIDTTPTEMKNFAEFLTLFTKKCIDKNEHENFWIKTKALSPTNLAKLVYSESIVRILKRELKNQLKSNVDDDQIKLALKVLFTEKNDIEVTKLKFRTQTKKKAPVAKVDIPTPVEINQIENQEDVAEEQNQGHSYFRSEENNPYNTY